MSEEDLPKTKQAKKLAAAYADSMKLIVDSHEELERKLDAVTKRYWVAVAALENVAKTSSSTRIKRIAKEALYGSVTKNNL
jgi:hypothetical protein